MSSSAQDHDLTASGSSAGCPTCPVCGDEFRQAWIGYPPEPYGDVCGCPDPDYDDARDEVRDDRRELSIEAQLEQRCGMEQSQ